MKKLIRRSIQLLSLGIIIIIGIVTIKTITNSSRQLNLEPIKKRDIDPLAMSRLSKSIQIPTVSKDGWVDTIAFLQLDTFLQQNYPLVDSLLEEIQIVPMSKVWKWPGKNSKLLPVLLTGHLDVVPIDPITIDQWDHPPFEGAMDDENVYGRGTMDDKVTVLGIMESVEQLLEEGYQPNRSIYFAFGHDEEIGGRNGAQKIAEYFKNENIYFEYAMDEGYLIIEEGMNGLNQPLALIGIAEKGYLSLTLTAKLKEGGHSSMPTGNSAIGILSRGINKLEKNPFPAKINGATKALFRYASPEMSFPYNALFANLWLTDGLLKRVLSGDGATSALIRTTTAPTILKAGVKDNVMPTQASVTINFRILPGETIESVIAQVKKIVDDERIKVEESGFGNPGNPSPVSSTDSLGFQLIQRSIAEVFPEAVICPALAIVMTDGRHYSEVSKDVFRFLPVMIPRSELSRIHGANERISKENYSQSIRFYRRLIENSCK